MRKFSPVTRREFSKLVLAVPPALLTENYLHAMGFPQTAASRIPDWDLIIKDGTVIDPSQKLHSALDIAISNGKVADSGKDLSVTNARKQFPAAGRLVVPGLINIHDHVYDNIGSGVNADRCCLPKGVTTIVDAGSAGHLTMEEFHRQAVDYATRVYALVDIEGLGLTAGIKIVDSQGNLQYIDPKRTIQTIERFAPFVIGIKMRASNSIEGPRDLEVLRFARQAADATKLPIMIHIGDSYSPLPEILKLLRKGDVITHSFNNQPHGILDQQGKILPEVLEARRRGIIFDLGAGATHFSFDVAEKCLQQNFLPDTFSCENECCDILDVFNKFLYLGMNVDQLIELATIRPAGIFNFGMQLGTLKRGHTADVAILELADGNVELWDSVGQKRIAKQQFRCHGTISAGKLLYWDQDNYKGYGG